MRVRDDAGRVKTATWRVEARVNRYSRKVIGWRAWAGILATLAAPIAACSDGSDQPTADSHAVAHEEGSGAESECRDMLARYHTGRRTTDSALAVRVRQCVNLLDNRSLARTGAMAQPMLDYAARMMLGIPEYHDEQRLPDDAGTGFGPLVRAYALPTLDGYTDVVQFENHGTRGALVAVVVMDTIGAPTTLPKAYLDLGLVRGVTCVYLAYQRTWTSGDTDADGQPLPANGWRGYTTEVTKTNTDTTCKPPQTVAWRRAHRTVTTGGGGTNRPFGDYPPVARFTENTSEQPLIGVKCADGWCDIGPRAQTAKAPMAPGNGRERGIKGWHDEQVLTMLDANNKYVPAVRAMLTPEPNIHLIPMQAFNTWQRMATITLQDPPLGKYEKWGLAVGDNVLRLKHLGGTNWAAELLPAGSTQWVPMTFVERHEHVDAAVPGTARFRWTEGDDGIWVPCGQGCCKVEGIEAS